MVIKTAKTVAEYKKITDQTGDRMTVSVSEIA